MTVSCRLFRFGKPACISQHLCPEKWNPVLELHRSLRFCRPPPELLGQRDKPLLNNPFWMSLGDSYVHSRNRRGNRLNWRDVHAEVILGFFRSLDLYGEPLFRKQRQHRLLDVRQDMTSQNDSSQTSR
jgi:hypothetical protein